MADSFLLFIGTSKATSRLKVASRFRATNDVHVTSAVKVHLRFIGSNCIKGLVIVLSQLLLSISVNYPERQISKTRCVNKTSADFNLLIYCLDSKPFSIHCIFAIRSGLLMNISWICVFGAQIKVYN